MFNVGGGEFLVILLIALIVLGPQKLPEVARQVGGMMRELRKLSTGFQDELRSAMDEPVEAAARERGRVVSSSEERAHPADPDDTDADDSDEDDEDDEDEDDESNAADLDDDAGDDDDGPLISTAEAAGMYDIEPDPPEPEPEPQPAPLSDAEAAGIYDDPEPAGDQPAGEAS